MSSDYEECEWSEDYEADEVQEPQIDTSQFRGQGSAAGTARLLQELKQFRQDFGYTAEPVGDNLYLWHVKLTDFPEDSLLKKDMVRGKVDHILIEITFPEQFPHDPPFVRVVRPRFVFMTGHVTSGGAICTELLCKSGWSAAYSIESIILQLKSGMVQEPGQGRLDLVNKQDYGMAEAKQAFERFRITHGW